MSKSSDHPPRELPTELVIGTIVRPHGIRGAVVVGADATMIDALYPGLAVRVVRSERELLAAEVATVAPYKGGVRMSFIGVDDRNGAEPLVGADVMAARADLPEPEEDGYYFDDLLGCVVVNDKGRELGPVVEVVPTGANDVYVVDGPEGEILVPAVEGAVLELDVEAGRIVVDPRALAWPDPPGAEPEPKRRRNRARRKADGASAAAAEPDAEADSKARAPNSEETP